MVNITPETKASMTLKGLFPLLTSFVGLVVFAVMVTFKVTGAYYQTNNDVKDVAETLKGITSTLEKIDSENRSQNERLMRIEERQRLRKMEN